ncbi:MAG: VOC family protein [Treponema sp.]|jgi:catechol 2,3-dioxygenase-like lactoylglutathione lyase family enzyme|nr:VOC family protein [Treponema sp.]
MNIKELNHVGLRTAGMDKAVHFYRDILGGTIIRDARTPDGKGRFVYVQIVDGVIEIIPGTPGADNLGLIHIAFLTADGTDLDSFAGQLKEAGYRFTVDPRPTSSGDGRLCFFEDSSGAFFELIQRNEKIRIPDLKNPHILEFDHISVSLHDSNYQKCADFYLNTMGFTVRRVLEKPGQVTTYYSWGKDTLETIYREGMAREPKPFGHIAFRVESCAAMKAYLESFGIECPEPREMGGYNIMNVKGPDGEILEFLDRPSLEELTPRA